MILTDTLNQPLALAIYATLGIIFGIIYMLNSFICAYLINSALYRHVSQTLYAILYGLTFFLITFLYFDYDLKIYHILICSVFTFLTSIALYLPMKKRHQLLQTKCNAFKTKVAQSKIVKRFKK